MYYKNFEELCKQKGVTPNKISKETGISTATLTSWKQGKYTPKIDKLQIISNYFGVSLEYLMRKEDVEWNPREQAIDYSVYLSEEEQVLIESYRSADCDLKEIIRRLLDYEKK